VQATGLQPMEDTVLLRYCGKEARMMNLRNNGSDTSIKCLSVGA
jgi:hypothetical protein